MPKVGERSSGSQRKHPSSPVYARAGTRDGIGIETGKEHQGGSQGELADSQEAEDGGGGHTTVMVGG